MPERKGRKRRNRDRRKSGDNAANTSTTPALTPANARHVPAAQLPSRNARLSGLAIAVVTVVLAVMLMVGAFSSDRSTGEVITRAVLGAAMVGLAVFVGVLVAFPAQLRDYFQRRRDRAAQR
jgi:hypothetical protein